jgi:hypothetical protein
MIKKTISFWFDSANVFLFFKFHIYLSPENLQFITGELRVCDREAQMVRNFNN